MLIEDVVRRSNNSSATVGDGNNGRGRIPKIIHVTSKSRCVTRHFADVLLQWQRALPDHDFVVHNDAAMERLLLDDEKWNDVFPALSSVLHCVHTAAGKTDLWRILIAWEYGGIYTDMDNAPGEQFANGTVFEDAEAFFVVEQGGFLSQYFFASTPHHPVLWFWMQAAIQRLLSLKDVEGQYVPYITGPGALKQGFSEFMKRGDSGAGDFHRVKAGKYVGVSNATVTVAGKRSRSDDIVRRNVVYKKRNVYKHMNMTHYSRVKAVNKNQTCLQRIYERTGRELLTREAKNPWDTS
jgi:hypothetical protein